MSGMYRYDLMVNGAIVLSRTLKNEIFECMLTESKSDPWALEVRISRAHGGYKGYVIIDMKAVCKGEGKEVMRDAFEKTIEEGEEKMG